MQWNKNQVKIMIAFTTAQGTELMQIRRSCWHKSTGLDTAANHFHVQSFSTTAITPLYAHSEPLVIL